MISIASVSNLHLHFIPESLLLFSSSRSETRGLQNTVLGSSVANLLPTPRFADFLSALLSVTFRLSSLLVNSHLDSRYVDLYIRYPGVSITPVSS